MSVARQMSPTPVARGLSMGKRRLLNSNRCGVLPPLNFLDNNSVRYFDQAWLGGKATDLVGGKRGNVNQSAGRPAVTGLVCDFGDGRPSATISILLPVVSTTWLTDPENPQKVLEKRGIFPFFATNTMTKVLAN
jgi:hypothetical protein